jgi:hypothetical protein
LLSLPFNSNPGGCFTYTSSSKGPFRNVDFTSK